MNDTPHQRQAYSVKQFREAYGLSHTTTYAEIKAGRLKVRKVGRRTLILRADAEAWANSLPDGREAA